MLTYKCELSSTNGRQRNELNRRENRFLREIKGKTGLDRIKNLQSSKLKKYSRQLGHFMRIEETGLVMKVYETKEIGMMKQKVHSR